MPGQTPTKKRKSNRWGEEYDRRIMYEGEEIVDYPDLVEKIKFKEDIEGMEKSKRIDEKFYEQIVKVKPQVKPWRSTLGDILLCIDKVDKIDYDILKEEKRRIEAEIMNF